MFADSPEWLKAFPCIHKGKAYRKGGGELRAIGYVRVSTEEQALTGVSLDAQEEKIRAYCIAKEWDLIRVIRDEGYSAKDLNRPRIQEIIEGCKRKNFDCYLNFKSAQF